MLWKLQVNFRTWVTLLCILGIGVFACAAASVKVSYLPNYGKKRGSPLGLALHHDLDSR
jgi:hypothetical protein